jgi:hypothetical protein
MYRVGFGDCFLLSLPAGGKQRHILIDCGAHFADLHTIPGVVADIAAETDGELAVVVASHIHKDHVSGFVTCRKEFANFKVGEVWLPWTANPEDVKAGRLWSKQEELLKRLALSLRAAGDRPEIAEMLDNFAGRAEQSPGMKNVDALEVLTRGFRGPTGAGLPGVRYLAAPRGGARLRLPPSLAGVTARLLAPSRAERFIAMLDPPSEHHYLRVATGDSGSGGTEEVPLTPFGEEWRVPAARHLMNCWPPSLKESLSAVLPDDLASLARWLEDALNNTSLVLHFAARGRNLLFSGDAQWGSWLSWMYNEGDTSRGRSAASRELLAELDFLKIAHHGSVNATPPEVVMNLARNTAIMCSTHKTSVYPQVPLSALIDALETKTNRLALSDQIDIKGNARSREDLRERRLPEGYTRGPFWIDYTL